MEQIDNPDFGQGAMFELDFRPIIEIPVREQNNSPPVFSDEPPSPLPFEHKRIIMRRIKVGIPDSYTLHDRFSLYHLLSKIFKGWVGPVGKNHVYIYANNEEIGRVGALLDRADIAIRCAQLEELRDQ